MSCEYRLGDPLKGDAFAKPKKMFLQNPKEPDTEVPVRIASSRRVIPPICSIQVGSIDPVCELRYATDKTCPVAKYFNGEIDLAEANRQLTQKLNIKV